MLPGSWEFICAGTLPAEQLREGFMSFMVTTSPRDTVCEHQTEADIFLTQLGKSRSINATALLCVGGDSQELPPHPVPEAEEKGSSWAQVHQHHSLGCVLKNSVAQFYYHNK